MEDINQCFDCGRKLDGENCPAGGVHDKPVSDIKLRAKEMFDDKVGGFSMNIYGGYDGNSKDIIRPIMCIREDARVFIDQVIDFAIAERDKEIVEMIEKEIKYSYENIGCTSVPIGGWCCPKHRDITEVSKKIINLITNTNK